MFQLSHKELQRRYSANLIQSKDEMFDSLSLDDLVEPGVKVKMSTAFDEVFERYARIAKPEGGGEKVFVFDAHRLIESI